ncbi:Uncharacterized protein APZ42_030036 [Daphnia magna]|uniref:Helix-turn-helix domain-containing protein n=1 Tax=Daphnia magna TaxID=35525 RepID=A0A162D3N7_9CRUS|nr:Uncharacterized protein APZ42_030036 [Daphnia magna]|mmetsp:Transcript_30282/g.87273  ORF Transcript_30282/g.87273 Transcript_30282/m.87273 type:complete len:574 (+) Transcript_30282:3775-5496(+)
MFFAKTAADDWNPNQLWMKKSTWTGPPSHEIPTEFSARVLYFLRRLGSHFTLRHGRSNLLPRQRHLLQFFRHSSRFLVIPSDKNLGPVVLERATYIQRALHDHLLDETTYRRLDEPAALSLAATTQSLIENWIGESRGHGVLSEQDMLYLHRQLEHAQDQPFAYFYLLAKIHKTPWATRPIVSVCGSITEGLAKWVHQELHPLCQTLSSYLQSSYELTQQLTSLRLPNSNRLRFFTADATSMYTNIDTPHALAVLPRLLRNHFTVTKVRLVLRAIEIIMTSNCFKFGDLYFQQLNGTAMGTPPAPAYATLYFGVHEQQSLPRFSENLLFYKRYLDDCFGIWLCDPDALEDERRWNAFQRCWNSFGKLRWTFSARGHTTDFLDLTLRFDPQSNRIQTRIFEKPQNLYAYLPPHSCHPPGIVKGLIFGEVNRIFRLTSTHSDRLDSLKRLFARVTRRGHNPTTVKKHLKAAVDRQFHPLPPKIRTVFDNPDKPIIFHMRYHPLNPSRETIQRLFHECLNFPEGEPELAELRNLDGYPILIDRLIVAFSRGLNLKNILFPRTLRTNDGPPASTFLP